MADGLRYHTPPGHPYAVVTGLRACVLRGRAPWPTVLRPEGRENMLAFEESPTEVIQAVTDPPGTMPEPVPEPQREAAVSRGEEPTEVIRAVGDTPGAMLEPGRGQQRKAAAGPGRYMFVGGTSAPLDDELADSGFGYERYSRLAGPVVRPRSDEPYRVQYRGIHRNKREWVATRLIALALVALDARFIYWLIFQSQYPHLGGWLQRGAALGREQFPLGRPGLRVGDILGARHQPERA